ncbi:MAG: FHA domain-containing protein [Anaerolineae bacterium]|nr:FHA domain-containing protein [Anaerolineae bacterium]
MAKLVIYEEIEGAETIFEDFQLSAHRILIGSSEDNNLVLDIPDIDPTHASLEFRNDHWVIQDLGGPGGTVLNGRQVDGPLTLHHNDLIELNTIKMRFYLEETVEATDTQQMAAHTAEPHPQPKAKPAKQEVVISGRVWFGTVAMMTIGVIVVIVILLAVADYLDLLSIADLLSM